MKLSELVKALQKIKKVHGDVAIEILDPDSLLAGEMQTVEPCIALWGDEKEEVTSVLLIDPTTAEGCIDEDEEEDEE